MNKVNISSSSSSGIGFLGLLTVALVVLKSLGNIGISWWLVFLPVLIPFILIATLLLFLLGAAIFEYLRRK